MTMKRLFIVSLFCLLAVPSVAQKFDCKEDWGKAKMPTGSIICVDFDYSLSSICGMPVADYVEFHESFMQDKAEAEQRFYEMFIKTLYGGENKVSAGRLRVTKDAGKANYVLHIMPYRINENGDFSGVAKIEDLEGNVVASFHRVTAKGGRFGSFVNLMGDGYESLAEGLADYIGYGLSKGKL